MNNKNNNNNHRAYAYAYHPHETEVFHGGRLGCWLPVEGRGARAARWALRAVEGLAFAVLIVGLCALCAMA